MRAHLLQGLPTKSWKLKCCIINNGDLDKDNNNNNASRWHFENNDNVNIYILSV